MKYNINHVVLVCGPIIISHTQAEESVKFQAPCTIFITPKAGCSKIN